MLRIDSKQLDVFASRLTVWLDRWIRENRYWKWSLAKSTGGLLDFFDDFVEPPSAVVRAPDFVCLHFECRPAAKKWWKDWLVLRVLKDIHAVFAEVTGVEKIGNCPSVQDKHSPSGTIT